MDAKNILEKLSIQNCPVGMGGCKNHGPSYDCCEYDIIIFAGRNQKESFLVSNTIGSIPFFLNSIAVSYPLSLFVNTNGFLPTNTP